MKIEIATKYLPQGTYGLTSGVYADGSAALVISLDGQPEMKATVCEPTLTPPAGNVLIKTWSENVGVMRALIGAGIIKPPIATHLLGLVSVFECPLTDVGLKLILQEDDE